MEKYLFKRKVSFRDLNKNSVSVEIEITTRNGYPEFTMSGEMGGCCCQISDHIMPANDGQKELLSVWEQFHLKKVEPTEMIPLLEKIITQVQDAEKQYTASIEAIFDMGEDGFDAGEHIREVMDLRDCSEEEALAFLCLGMELGLTFGELNETFGGDEYNHEYYAYGIDYYIGEDDELEGVAYSYLEEEDWLWRDAVAAKATELGFTEWIQQVISLDGWASVLNGWDGKSFEHRIGDKWIYGCRR